MALVLANTSIVGTVGSISELRHFGSGTNQSSVINFTVAVTRSSKDQATGEWKDQPTYWVPVTIWGRAAENVEKTIQKGDRVIVVGRIDMKESYTYKDKDGVEREAAEKSVLTAEFVGVDLTYTTATIERKTRGAAPAQEQKVVPASKAASRPAPTPAPAPPADPTETDVDDNEDEDDVPWG